MLTFIKKVMRYLLRFVTKRTTHLPNLDDFYMLPKSQITYSNDLLYTYHNADFIKEPLFQQAYQLAKKADGGILLKNYDIQWRIHILCWAASYAKRLEGDFVDCGCGSGIFASAIIHYIDFAKTSKKYYLLDSFEGLDLNKATETERGMHESFYEKRKDLYAEVKENFAPFNTQIIKGFIPETLKQMDTDKICFLSVDLNSAIPEIEALEYLWDKIVIGGIVVLDDYGYANKHEAQRVAHDAFALRKSVKILSLPTCQAILIKQ